MRSMKLVISLVSALLVVSAAIVAVVIFQEELMKFYRSCCDYCSGFLKAQKEEYDDFADV